MTPQAIQYISYCSKTLHEYEILKMYQSWMQKGLLKLSWVGIYWNIPKFGVNLFGSKKSVFQYIYLILRTPRNIGGKCHRCPFPLNPPLVGLGMGWWACISMENDKVVYGMNRILLVCSLFLPMTPMTTEWHRVDCF